MAILTGINSRMRGKVGAWVYSQNKGQTVVSQKADPKETPVRTLAQMNQRTRLANLYCLWNAFGGKLKPSFERLAKHSTNYGTFLSMNLTKTSKNVYLTKQMAKNGSCVVAPYVVSLGTLPSIGVTVDREGRMSSNIMLGDDFTIDATTTVAQFSKAVVDHNTDFEMGDQITCFVAHQSTDPVTGYPVVKMLSDAVVLNGSDNAKLLDKVSAMGFTARDGRLSTQQSVDGGVAWIHSRREGGVTRVSSQYFVGENSLLEDYVTDEARWAAIESYGGINSSNYLTPSKD